MPTANFRLRTYPFQGEDTKVWSRRFSPIATVTGAQANLRLPGGSSGIGLAVAQAAAREGAVMVIASSRRALFGRLGAIDHLVFTAGESLQHQQPRSRPTRNGLPQRVGRATDTVPSGFLQPLVRRS